MKRFSLAAFALLACTAAFAQSSGSPTAPVSPDNFRRAESDMYFGAGIKEAGGIGRFFHHRDVMAIEKQTVIRANRDTLYSTAVFDLDAGPVTITLPDAGKRFMSMILINEEQYTGNARYGAGKYTISKEQIGTRYVMAGIRTFIDPTDTNDLARVHALQDAIQVEQAGKGSFEAPNWDRTSQKQVRDALLILAGTLPDSKRMFGPKDEVDPVRHLIGTASGWGGNPEKDATYVTVTPPKNDGKTVYRLAVKDVPVDGFWSVSMYNAGGYFEPNSFNAYSLNNLTAKKEVDGSVVIQFGGCDGNIPNCLPTVDRWNYWVRLYRPRQAILNGNWTFPQPTEVQ